MRLRVVTWNLFHGRAVPGAGRDLLDAFARTLAGWEWDVALLQEVPPWWSEAFARTLGCEARSVLTSRNAALGLRRRAARRVPDLLGSWGGGANVILSRDEPIVGAHSTLLCRWPERRRVLGVELRRDLVVCTLHASRGPSAAAARDVARAAALACGWADGRPLVFGGDLNLREVSLPGLSLVASDNVDHVLVAGGLQAVGPASLPPRGTLSDHAALAVTLELGRPGDGRRAGGVGARHGP